MVIQAGGEDSDSDEDFIQPGQPEDGKEKQLLTTVVSACRNTV